jgi:[lysine-biosynthesis-protein LysW]--L-2-aminoadipate ligase
MYRRSEHWRANAALGAWPEPCRLDSELADLARAAGRAVGGGILGVDLLEDGTGRILVNEVNATTEFRAAHQVCDTDIAGAMAAYTLDRL